MIKPETRIIPENTPPKFFAQHLKPYEFIADRITGKRVLEVGSGDGYGTLFLAQRATHATGVDYDFEVIREADRKYRRANLRYLCMDACSLQFPDKSFDAVCSFQVIEHLLEDRIARYLSEIRRVLDDEGEFFLSTLNVEHAAKSPKEYKKNPAHVKEFRYDELRHLVSGAFGRVQMYGLHISRRHWFYQRLKKSGICRYLPEGLNPVANFYAGVTTADFVVVRSNLRRGSDFICVCRK